MKLHNIDSIIEDFDVLGIKDSIDFNLSVITGYNNADPAPYLEWEYKTLFNWNKNSGTKITSVTGDIKLISASKSPGIDIIGRDLDPVSYITVRGGFNIRFVGGSIIYFACPVSYPAAIEIKYYNPVNGQRFSKRVHNPSNWKDDQTICYSVLMIFKEMYPEEYKKIIDGE